MKSTTSFQLICENCDSRFAKTKTNVFQRFCCSSCGEAFYDPNGRPTPQQSLTGTSLVFPPNDTEIRKQQREDRLFEQHGGRLVVGALSPI